MGGLGEGDLETRRRGWELTAAQRAPWLSAEGVGWWADWFFASGGVEEPWRCRMRTLSLPQPRAQLLNAYHAGFAPAAVRHSRAAASSRLARSLPLALPFSISPSNLGACAVRGCVSS